MGKKGSKNDYLNQLINELTKAGEKAIHLAYNTREFKNRLFNLRDSYGSAVYYNGQLQKRTIRYLGPEMGTSKSGLTTNWVWDKPRSMPDWRGERRITGDYIQMRGRDEIMDFFEQYKPTADGLHLVVVAAMWYANVLEKGGGNLKRKYKVISGAKDVMQMIQRQFKGSILIEIDEKRDMNRMPSIKGKDWKH